MGESRATPGRLVRARAPGWRAEARQPLAASLSCPARRSCGRPCAEGAASSAALGGAGCRETRRPPQRSRGGRSWPPQPPGLRPQVLCGARPHWQPPRGRLRSLSRGLFPAPLSWPSAASFTRLEHACLLLKPWRAGVHRTRSWKWGVDVGSCSRRSVSLLCLPELAITRPRQATGAPPSMSGRRGSSRWCACACACARACACLRGGPRAASRPGPPWQGDAAGLPEAAPSVPLTPLSHAGFTAPASPVPGGGAEVRREGHPGHQRQPDRVHPPGRRLPAQQADPPALPGLPAGPGQRGQPGVAAHVRPAGDPGRPRAGAREPGSGLRPPVSGLRALGSALRAPASGLRAHAVTFPSRC